MSDRASKHGTERRGSSRRAVLADGEHGFTSASFFAMFPRNVREGLFCDPMHGGNRDMVGGKWVGFPGDPLAYGEPYAEYIDKWHPPYEVVPKGVQ